MHSEVTIRDANDGDSLDLIGLVARCWSKYPGCVLDVHGEEPDLLAPATAFSRHRGRLWIAHDDARVEGMIGIRPGPDERTALLVKLYVDPSARRRGIGSHLVGVVEEEAVVRGAERIELWSDTRFSDAHRLYERLGYTMLPDTRELHDLSNSVEHHFAKSL